MCIVESAPGTLHLLLSLGCVHIWVCSISCCDWAVCQSGYAVELKEHCAGVLGFAVVSRFYVGLSMHLGARGDVLPVGRTGMRCGWVHDSKRCAGNVSFVYSAGCGWQFAFAVVNGLFIVHVHGAGGTVH